MSKTSTYPLRLPQSLKNELVKLAKRDGTSVNQFINIAVAEKISALDTTDFFTKRAENADLDAFRKILFRSGGEAPTPSDEIIK